MSHEEIYILTLKKRSGQSKETIYKRKNNDLMLISKYFQLSSLSAT